jgi:hypothetical protein
MNVAFVLYHSLIQFLILFAFYTSRLLQTAYCWQALKWRNLIIINIIIIISSSSL